MSLISDLMVIVHCHIIDLMPLTVFMLIDSPNRIIGAMTMYHNELRPKISLFASF